MKISVKRFVIIASVRNAVYKSESNSYFDFLEIRCVFPSFSSRSVFIVICIRTVRQRWYVYVMLCMCTPPRLPFSTIAQFYSGYDMMVALSSWIVWYFISYYYIIVVVIVVIVTVAVAIMIVVIAVGASCCLCLAEYFFCSYSYYPGFFSLFSSTFFLSHSLSTLSITFVNILLCWILSKCRLPCCWTDCVCKGIKFMFSTNICMSMSIYLNGYCVGAPASSSTIFRCSPFSPAPPFRMRFTLYVQTCWTVCQPNIFIFILFFVLHRL